jgi:hypothetical protein
VVFSNGKDWKVRRRFCLKNLRDFGFGKSSMETLIMDELKVLGDTLCPAVSKKADQKLFHDVELDQSLNACVTNVIWWLMASKVMHKFLHVNNHCSIIIAFSLAPVSIQSEIA